MNSSGLTLPELILCLLLVGTATQTFIGPIRLQADALALRGIREEVVALVHRARMEARGHGDAAVVIEEGADPLLLVSGGRPPARVPLASRGVRLEVTGARSSLTLRFGPLGVARFGSASVVLTKGGAQARLVVSSYGRIRR